MKPPLLKIQIQHGKKKVIIGFRRPGYLYGIRTSHFLLCKSTWSGLLDIYLDEETVVLEFIILGNMLLRFSHLDIYLKL